MRPIAIAICALTLICGTSLTLPSAHAAGDQNAEAREGKRKNCDKHELFKELDLSDEQREQLQAARKAVRAAHEAAESKEAHKAAHDAFVTKVESILDAEQFAKWKEHHDERMAKRRANKGDREGKGKRGGDNDA